MRPRIVELLESLTGTSLVKYLVPTSTTIWILAVTVVMWIMIVRGRRVGLAPKDVFGAGIVGVAAGLVGSRLFHLLQHLSLTIENPRLLLNLTGGTTSWGGYLFGSLAFCWFLALKRRPILPFLDLLTACLGLGPAIDRWGCLMSGCCFGRITELPWAIEYPRNTVPFVEHLAAGLITPEAHLSLSVHPVQVYGSLAGLILFFTASRIWQKYRNRMGITFTAYWLLYGGIRFGIEFFRGDADRYGSLQLTMSQYICAGIVTVMACWLALLVRRDFSLTSFPFRNNSS